ncbi:MAG: glutamine--fructose-6-phosphate transaminase (isomerizing) [Candidatus Omnitrophica bacterium]|nr:glutamine--fructose-6-phosphate transaminase (isomerizing) [Candidatus Omnitrophota bacterium]
MCGIVGYVGSKEALPILIEGLKNLEYRGYDSSGVAVIAPGAVKVDVRKEQGKIRRLEELLSTHALPKAHIGIAHTRWATHGAPCRKNSHPHENVRGTIAVVHNGIIENYQTLKAALIRKGVAFLSETDTEVIVHLIDQYFEGDLVKAVQRAIRDLEGAFAIGVVAVDDPETLVVARVGSPLIIGVGKNEYFVASDVPAIMRHVRRVIYLKDGEMAVLRKDGISVMTFDGKKAPFTIDQVTFHMDAAKKQGFPHFMLKEIHEQPDVLAKMFGARVKKGRVVLDGLGLSEKALKNIRRVQVVACGTAYHAGLVGRYIIEELARVPVDVDVSSEFRYRNPIIDSRTLVLAVSQSGETADTLAAVREARAKGAKIVSICNVIGSSLARESDGVLYTHAGPEIGVASTKAYTAQVAMLYLFAIKLSEIHGAIPPKNRAKLVKDLVEIPNLCRIILEGHKDIAKVAKEYSNFGCFLYLGRNINYPSALEGALKLKEISYIPAEGYAAGEMKHGPIALIDEYRAVVCIAPESDVYEKMISNIQEILSRKGKVLAIATAGDEEIRTHATHVIAIPRTNKIVTPLLAVLPLQIFAYHVAVNRGCDVDQPRNLAKSVTVE